MKPFSQLTAHLQWIIVIIVLLLAIIKGKVSVKSFSSSAK